MKGSDYIALAKGFYPASITISSYLSLFFLNNARRKAKRDLRRIKKKIYSLPANTQSITIDNFIEISSIQGRHQDLVWHLARCYNEIPLENTLIGLPMVYRLTGNMIEVFPKPSIDIDLIVYGVWDLQLIYTPENLNLQDTDLKDSDAKLVAIEYARNLALYDQQIELSQFLGELYKQAYEEVKERIYA